jgi:hypothetical protein
MASTYVNDLRLNEMATGDASGSWGTVTNTNLELIGEAFSYGTETIGDADSTLTIADGAADAARSFYLKITSSVDLTTTRIVTLGPNTVSKVWMIENATTGSQVITIKQGSGATINVPNGQVKMISTDGAGSGGAVLDLLVDVDLTGTTTLVNLDVSGTLGVTGVLTATSLDISGDIDVDGTTNLDVVDIDGATQIDATVTVGVDDTGYDVKFFGATAGAYMLWDESADDLILGGAAGLSVNSTALVTGVLTTTAATVSNGGGQFNGAINVGVDDTGYDVKFFGATAGKYMLWDESADTLEVSGTVVAAAGTALLPSITTTGDLNTGMWFPAADTIAFSEGGVEALRINSSGNVGIGTDSPTSKLDLFTSLTGGTISTLTFSANNSVLAKKDYVQFVPDIQFNTATSEAGGYTLKVLQQGAYKNSIVAAGITNNSSNYLAFSTTSEAIRIISSGNVGIGTDSPRVKLDLRSDAVIAAPTPLANAVTSGVFAIGDSVGSVVGLQLNGSSYDTYIQSRNMGAGSAAYNLLLQPLGGNVGIGISLPGAKLDVNPSSGTIFRAFTDGVSQILIGNGGASTNYYDGDTQIYRSGNATERMRIDSSGGLITNPAAGGHAVFNEAGVDADFRVESSDHANMLFVDAAENVVGIRDADTTLDGSFVARGEGTYSSGNIAGLFYADSGKRGTIRIRSNGDNSAECAWDVNGALRWMISARESADAQGAYCMKWYPASGTPSYGAVSGYVMTLTQSGNLTVAGSLSKGSGSFKIKHPLPEKNETHDLVHSFVEAPQADNLYRGKATLVAGQATVNIDTVAGMTEGTFVLLNREIQCFTSNETGWTAVRGSLSGNILTIEAQDNTCTDTISWMVVGERQDTHMYDTDWTDENGKVIVEPLRPAGSNDPS